MAHVVTLEKFKEELSETQKTEFQLDVVTYNVNGVGGLEVVAKLIEDFKADVVSFQESYHDSERVSRVLQSMIKDPSKTVIINQACHKDSKVLSE